MHLPDLATLRWVPLVIVAIATVLIFIVRWPVLRVLGISAALGLLAGMLGLPVN